MPNGDDLVRERARRVRMHLAGVAVLMVAIALIHWLVMPLDVLWFRPSDESVWINHGAGGTMKHLQSHRLRYKAERQNTSEKRNGLRAVPAADHVHENPLHRHCRRAPGVRTARRRRVRPWAIRRKL